MMPGMDEIRLRPRVGTILFVILVVMYFDLAGLDWSGWIIIGG